MNKLLSLIAGLALSVGVTHAVTLGDLIPGGTITAGPVTFGEFGWATATGVTADEITVAVSYQDSVAVIRFGGPIAAALGQAADYELVYSAVSTVPMDMIDQAFNLGGQGEGGSVVIGETVFGNQGRTVQIAQSSVGFLNVGPVFDPIDPPAEPVQGDSLYFLPADVLWIDKDIYLVAEDLGIVTASTVYQSFHLVPEPHEYALVAGIGLLGLGVWRRVSIR